MTYVEQAEKLFNSGCMGCVMLDVTPLDLEGVIPESWCYSSPNPARPWISGLQKEFHVTLLYGLLDNANTIKADVDRVLEGWDATSSLLSNDISVFPAQFEDEDYSCIVAEFKNNQRLIDAHGRLSQLPHINTFPDYRPHATLAYVHRGRTEKALAAIHHLIGDITWQPAGLNYGRPGREH